MKYILVLFALITCYISKADHWDNLTKENADQVVAYLEANPYLFDYCDCCRDEGLPKEVYFFRVLETAIIPCEWNLEMFSVKVAKYEMIATLHYDDSGIIVEDSYSMIGEDGVSDLIFMNYTWGFNPKTKMAAPIFDMVEYDYYGEDNKPCNVYFKFPDPSKLSQIVKYKKYKKWYKKAMK